MKTFKPLQNFPLVTRSEMNANLMMSSASHEYDQYRSLYPLGYNCTISKQEKRCVNFYLHSVIGYMRVNNL